MIWRASSLGAIIFVALLAAALSSRQTTAQTEHLQLAVWAATASAAIAAISAMISIVSAREAVRKMEREFVEIRIKYFDDFRKWAELSASCLNEAVYLCDLDPSLVKAETFFDRRHRLRTALLNQTDTGRWFFPNIEIDEFGAHKKLGFRGHRHEVLDTLVIAYQCLDRMDYQKRSDNYVIRDQLMRAKRQFVGQVQRILDPARQQKEFERIARRAWEAN